MKNELKKVLDSLDHVDYLELRHALDFAEMTRSIKKTYDMSDDRMMSELKVTKEQLDSMYSGSYPWDLMMWAKLEALSNRMFLEEKERKRSIVKDVN